MQRTTTCTRRARKESQFFNFNLIYQSLVFTFKFLLCIVKKKIKIKRYRGYPRRQGTLRVMVLILVIVLMLLCKLDVSVLLGFRNFLFNIIWFACFMVLILVTSISFFRLFIFHYLIYMFPFNKTIPFRFILSYSMLLWFYCGFIGFIRVYDSFIVASILF